jgi:hypothetical protein
MSAPRQYITLPERLAAALACLLPQDHRDALRREKVPAAAIISMFEQDHIHLKAWGGPDVWWNLNPRLKADHKTKSRLDTKRAAKVKRLERDQIEFRGRMLRQYETVLVKNKHKWPTRKIMSRAAARGGHRGPRDGAPRRP